MTEENLKKLIVAAKVFNLTDSYDVMQALKENGYKCRVDDGSSKICIIPTDLPFVIKWAYQTYNSESQNEAVQEVKIYEASIPRNLSCFFPKTEIFMEDNGITFVKQAKVDCNACDYKAIKTKLEKISRTPTEKIVEKMERDIHKGSRHYNRTLSRLWAKTALSLYGKAKCKSLCNFIVENGINDLHEYNLGFIGIRPVLLDFSGYHR